MPIRGPDCLPFDKKKVIKQFSIVRSSAGNMLNTSDNLDAAMALLAVPGLRLGYTAIVDSDEFELQPAEAIALQASVPKRRRESGAARKVGRRLLRELGIHDCYIGRASSGAPIWPTGIVGSLAHDSSIAAAAVARRSDFVCLGIDVEPTLPLAAELAGLVATPNERQTINEYPLYGSLLFTAKEAVFKATNPFDHEFLEHHDVEVDLLTCRAWTQNGRMLDLRFGISSHIITLAFIRASGGPF
jgi:4'-phosphopantetheinyl transferase EntD